MEYALPKSMGALHLVVINRVAALTFAGRHDGQG